MKREGGRRRRFLGREQDSLAVAGGLRSGGASALSDHFHPFIPLNNDDGAGQEHSTTPVKSPSPCSVHLASPPTSRRVHNGAHVCRGSSGLEPWPGFLPSSLRLACAAAPYGGCRLRPRLGLLSPSPSPSPVLRALRRACLRRRGEETWGTFHRRPRNRPATAFPQPRTFSPRRRAASSLFSGLRRCHFPAATLSPPASRRPCCVA
ncbi:hypothetical protein BS78_05G014100 [Paspalum vaginatum]|nr:hypothetical protein BS78_05G014100 [Paspalum vaginatum]